jgi:hypothetical protein
MGFMVDTMLVGKVFFRVRRFMLPIFIPTTAPYSLTTFSWMLYVYQILSALLNIQLRKVMNNMCKLQGKTTNWRYYREWYWVITACRLSTVPDVRHDCELVKYLDFQYCRTGSENCDGYTRIVFKVINLLLNWVYIWMSFAVNVQVPATELCI